MDQNKIIIAKEQINFIKGIYIISFHIVDYYC
jgi:hypothetical protein